MLGRVVSAYFRTTQLFVFFSSFQIAELTERHREDMEAALERYQKVWVGENTLDERHPW